MNVHSLWSSIGGIMSLWLGMSVMFLFEIIELIVGVVRDRFSNRKAVLPQGNRAIPKLSFSVESSPTTLTTTS